MAREALGLDCVCTHFFKTPVMLNRNIIVALQYTPHDWLAKWLASWVDLRLGLGGWLTVTGCFLFCYLGLWSTNFLVEFV